MDLRSSMVRFPCSLSFFDLRLKARPEFAAEPGQGGLDLQMQRLWPGRCPGPRFASGVCINLVHLDVDIPGTSRTPACPGLRERYPPGFAPGPRPGRRCLGLPPIRPAASERSRATPPKARSRAGAALRRPSRCCGKGDKPIDRPSIAPPGSTSASRAAWTSVSSRPLT